MGRFRRQALIPLIGLLATAGGIGHAQPTVFRVDVRLVRLLVTVKDPGGNPVGSLQKTDFTVFDNGAPQELALFERHTEQPLSVSVLVDTSGSTAKDLRYEVESVGRFLRALFREGNPLDAAALVSFNHDVTVQSSFTRRLARLEGALKTLRAEAGTSLYDAVYLGAQNMEMRDGRRAMIVVTDGGDTTSVKNFHDALEAAHLADAVIYPILVVPITNDAGRNVGGENALAALAAGTGGRVFFPSAGPALDEAFAEILRDLRTQYLLTYYPKNVPLTKNRFHQLQVKVARPGLRVITRSGYYGDAEDTARPERGAGDASKR